MYSLLRLNMFIPPLASVIRSVNVAKWVDHLPEADLRRFGQQFIGPGQKCL
jgi:hypothetical protein